MKNLKDQLQQLFDKSEWTDEEKQWLLTYLEETGGEDLEVLMRAKFDADQKTETENRKPLEKALESIHEKIGIEKRPGRVVDGRMKFFRVMAAAAVIGLLIFGGYFLFNQNSPKEPLISKTTKEVRKNDVLPGGNKAVLTLADGSTIVLNDEQNGELAEQGHTKVLKLNGRITYQPSDSGSGKLLYNTISTPRGGQYQVVLADGSAVWLNAESSLRFPTDFVGKERRVEIRGEAYFEVAKNKAMPFVVSVNGSEVQVLGTHFNVQAYDDEASIKTTLLEGAVKFVAGNNRVTLKPGQQSQLNKNGDVAVLSGVDTDKIVAWKNGYFLFDGEGLATITKQLARWYDVEVTGANKIEDKFYAEIPRSTKLSVVLHALELTGKVHFAIEGKKVIVKP